MMTANQIAWMLLSEPTKLANDLVSMFIEEMVNRMPHGGSGVPAAPPAPADPSWLDRGDDAVKDVGDHLFGEVDVPDNIEVGKTRMKLPDAMYTPEHLQQMAEHGVTREQFESFLSPQASVTIPGQPVKDVITYGRVGVPLAGLGIGAGAIAKGALKTRRHGEILQAMKNLVGKKDK
jgi:hypothetical protein